MWIVCSADDSHEIPSLIFSKNIDKIKMLLVVVVISTLMVNSSKSLNQTSKGVGIWDWWRNRRRIIFYMILMYGFLFPAYTCMSVIVYRRQIEREVDYDIFRKREFNPYANLIYEGNNSKAILTEVQSYCTTSFNTYSSMGKFFRRQIDDFFSYFSQKTAPDISCKESTLETICMECQTVFLEK